MAGDVFGYEGKRALVVGGATGMGAAAAKVAAERGAEVIVFDHAPVDYPVAAAVQVDLQDPSAIDAALTGLGPVDAVFSAAGIADGPGLMRINFIGHRHIIDRLVAEGWLPRGSAICMIASVAGLGWEAELPMLLDFLATPDYSSAVTWVDEHEGTNNYRFSKQVINAYVAREAFPFMKSGIRVNAICPGPTDTPLARANADLWLTFGEDYRAAAGIGYHSTEQMGNAMVFLNSEGASGISGINLLVDAGHVMSSMTGTWTADKAIIDLLNGRQLLPD
jgi:NAD(P)-dependent dehydrogenase (short-subunit alcohol dehydrogenase family)